MSSSYTHLAMNSSQTQSSQPAASTEFPKQYRPSDHEPRVWDRWIDAKAFHANPERVLSGEAKPYTILIPPPNVTDRLHLGHALNNTLQDTLARFHRMQGFETLWMPGTDHAGIATQAVVEKRLRASGQLKGALRESMTREQFVEIAQAFKDEYKAVIIGQLQKMGCSCDWDRERFTMDDQCAKAVREAFFRFFKDGLIYRGKRLVNWDPALQTAVADDECFDEEIDGAFYYLRYPLVHRGADTTEDAQPVTWDELVTRGYPGAEQHPGDQEAWITVATTRPETYLGDTAVAINPHDPRAKSLRGMFVELPLVGRVIPIIEDSYVVLPEVYARDDEERADPKAKMATGFLKVTPAHDPNDYEIGQRHRAEIEAAGLQVQVNIFAPDATVSDKHGWTDVGSAHIFVGMPREDARKAVVTAFKNHSLLEAIKPHLHSVKHSDRSKAVIEPYLSDQWYVKVTDERLAKAANEVLHKGELEFYPARYAKTYEQWHDGIRDWCISRQLWWGHRVPVWSKSGVTEDELKKVHQIIGDGLSSYIEWRHESSPDGTSTVHVCFRHAESEQHWAVENEIPLLERLGFVQDPDVLDTWFSSGLWPLSTLGWPNQYGTEGNLLRAFNPTSVLCTAREIITLWVSRMVMFNRYLYGKGGGEGPVPFHDVFIHAVIQDGQGQKMSKSLGNGVDPLDIIASHGSDAMRFTLCHMATQTQDVRMPVDLICPHTGETFPPKMITNKDGYVVPAPIQTSPKDPSKKMVTGYGVASGEAKASAEMPLARNTSSKFDLGRNFANKLWNATRFALSMLDAAAKNGGGNSGGEPIRVCDLALVDRWMLSRLATQIKAAAKALDEYQFADHATALYDIAWRDFCDWYLEAIKPTVANSAAQQAVLAHTIEAIVRALHPTMPYVTEVIFERLRTIETAPIAGVHMAPSRLEGLLATAGWPELDAALIDPAAEAAFDRSRRLITAVREVRATFNTPPKRQIVVHAPPHIPITTPDLYGSLDTVRSLTGAREITQSPAPAASVAFTFDSAEWRLSDLADAVDAASERARLSKLIADLEKSIATLDGRLSNPGYADKAPAHMVQQTRDQLTKAKAERDAAKNAMEALA
jgi:valyl-tRNA synthetase